MDQLPDLLNYKLFLEEHKNTTHFNLSDASDILTEFEKNLFTFDKFSTVVLLSLYIPTFVIGLVGNILIIVSVSAERARKANLYFLVNLALADLAVTVLCIPTSIGTLVYKLWVYGRFLCKFTAFIQGVAVAVSIYSMTAMSVDRYISLQYPVAAQKMTSAYQSCVLLLFMWIGAAVFMGPLIYIRDIDMLEDVPFLRPLPFCIEEWPHDRDRQAYGVFLLFVIFIIPAFTITICYGNVGKALCTIERHQRVSSDGSTQRLVSRQKAARMVIILICVFMICWLPYNIISTLSDLYENVRMTNALPFVLWLGHAHSAFNPMLYWSLNRHFRDSVHRLAKVVKITGCSSDSTQTVSLPQYV
ncbi:QRFP-like peptide receptor [Ruditapes philippinarum]|uniref:QRFP-like peptide receptor n=1 Tax=Ruditapes philippinarum TaxID=129788 RepID=UPI00295AAF6B|nr:QRFP-like peptide receptor [Ruditapes philippinarum]